MEGLVRLGLGGCHAKWRSRSRRGYDRTSRCSATNPAHGTVRRSRGSWAGWERGERGLECDKQVGSGETVVGTGWACHCRQGMFLESSDLREAEYQGSECVACLTRSQWASHAIGHVRLSTWTPGARGDVVGVQRLTRSLRWAVNLKKTKCGSKCLVCSDGCRKERLCQDCGDGKKKWV